MVFVLFELCSVGVRLWLVVFVCFFWGLFGFIGKLFDLGGTV